MIPKTRTVATRVGAVMLAGAWAWRCGDGAGRGPEIVRRVTVPTGTQIRVALSRELDARAVEAGERFHARVLEGVPAPGRDVLVPPGAVVRGRVVAVREGGGSSDASMGTGIVLGTPAADAVLPRGSEMRIELNEPLRVRMP